MRPDYLGLKSIEQRIVFATRELERFSRLETVEISLERHMLRAIVGAPSTQSSFKSILGLGMLVLAHQEGLISEGQHVVESSSGSMAVGLAYACRILGHPLTIVSDPKIPGATLRKVTALGATMDIVDAADPRGGFQQARERRLIELIKRNDDWHWPNQNDSALNPQTYLRWLIPRIERCVNLGDIDAGIFAVGSGGHIMAFSTMLAKAGIKTWAADRYGSITFGHPSAPSILRGVGNMGRVPMIAATARGSLAGVIHVTDREALDAMTELECRGISVGTSSGVAVSAAGYLSRALESDFRPEILTFLPDRGELYDTVYR